MRWLDCIYVNCYNLSYKDGLHDRRIDPVMAASFLIGCCVLTWGLSLALAYVALHHIHTSRIIWQLGSLLVLALVMGPVYYYYSAGERYLDLYTDYKHRGRLWTRKKGLLLMFGVILFPLLVLFGLLFTGMLIHPSR